MNYSWDETKRQANKQIHGLDFAGIVRFQWKTAVLRPTYSGRFGSRRFMAIGRLDDDLVAGVFASLGREAISIVSLRRANRQERREYEQSQGYS